MFDACLLSLGKLGFYLSSIIIFGQLTMSEAYWKQVITSKKVKDRELRDENTR